MNWMWRFDETVAATLDTFRTMLNLMEEYPEFKFSQSQASVYKIVEEFDPDMLEEIKKRIKEGRWEVTASTWVESDKNMPNGESLVRHILYTKRYLSELLGVDPGTLNIDFEPDTFGHNLNVPEILARGGVKYYYHCRGYDGHDIYRWKSPSGSSVIMNAVYK
jgi:alpha-mannosidase